MLLNWLRRKMSVGRADQQRKRVTGGKSRSTSKRYRPAVEELERRLAPATGLELDPSFGQNGLALTDLAVPRTANAENVGQSTAVQSDGKIIVAGSEVTAANGWCFSIVRYNADGSLDTSFGNNGRVATDFLASDDTANAAAVYPGGRFVLAGLTVGSSTGQDFALARYLDNGAPLVTLGGSAGTELDSQNQLFTWSVSDGDANLDFHAVKNSTATDRTALATLADDTFVVVEAYYDGANEIELLINGATVGSAVLTNVVDDEDLTVSFGIQNGAAAAKVLTVDWIRVMQER